MTTRTCLAILLGTATLLGSPCPGRASSDDGTWFQYTSLPRATRGANAAVYDPVRQRLVIAGGWNTREGVFWDSPRINFNDAWAFDLAGEPTWARLDTSATPLPGLTRAVAVYDSEQDRIVVVAVVNDTSAVIGALSLTPPYLWSPLAVAGARPALALESASWAMDASRNRLMCFGGGADSVDDLWALDLGAAPAWEQIVAPGVAPALRTNPAVIYDSHLDRLVVFGGRRSGSTTQLNDVWALSLSPALQWEHLLPGGSSPTSAVGASAVYDPDNDRLLLFQASGNHALQFGPGLSWAVLPHRDWGEDHTSEFGVCFDPPRHRVLAFGGYTDDGPFSADTWQLDVSSDTWSRIHQGPTTQTNIGGPMVVDPVRDRLLMATTSGVEAYAPGSGTWTTVAPPCPTPIQDKVLAWYDPYRDEARYYGDFGSSSTPSTESWALSLAGTPTWSRQDISGTALQRNETLAYDASRDRLIGFFDAQTVKVLSLDDGAAWTTLGTNGTPPPSDAFYSRGFYDGAHDGLVLAGGYSIDSYIWQMETWMLSLSGTPTWSVVAPLNYASFWAGAYPVFDPVRVRGVSFGGSSGGSFYEYGTNRADALSLPTAAGWELLDPAGYVLPGSRLGHAVAYDPLRDELVAWGGSNDFQTFGDVWGLVFGPGHPPAAACGGDATWNAGGVTPLSFDVENPYPFAQDVAYTLASARDWPGYPISDEIHVDPASTAMISIPAPAPDTASGTNPLTFTAVFRQSGFRAVCARNFTGAATAVEPAAAPRISLALASPNPGPELRVRFSLPDGEPARLRVFDVGGRAVYGKDVGALGAGEHVEAIGRGDLAPGLYFVRLARAGRALTLRSVVIR